MKSQFCKVNLYEMKKKLIVSMCFALVTGGILFGQEEGIIVNAKKERTWFQSFKLSGYMQFRYNGLIQTNPDLGCSQCDKSWGGNPKFSFRRIRISFRGQIHPQLYFYIQPDFAGTIGTKKNTMQLKGAFFDFGFDKKNRFRVRLGQAKVPYSFEILQSSSDRTTLDRDDAINSAINGERDLGIYFMWTPLKRKEIFKTLKSNGLKGTGDVGLINFGVMSGQPSNEAELNKNKHFAFRATYPFYIKNQLFETSIQAYTGMYEMDPSDISPGVKHNDDLNYLDQRVAATAIWYPKPFGIQAEYNIGRGPEFNNASDSIELQDLTGGYVMLNYLLHYKNHRIIPFVKYKYYDGGKKFEQDARSYHINELEFGVEWQIFNHFELTAQYVFSERRYEDFDNQDNFQKGNLLRLQAQFKF